MIVMVRHCMRSLQWKDIGIFFGEWLLCLCTNIFLLLDFLVLGLARANSGRLLRVWRAHVSAVEALAIHVL